MKRQVLGIVILCLTSLTQGFAQTGILKGKITDSKTGEELIGAAIVIEGTTTGTTTDFMGDYTMPPLEAGTYTIRCQYISYEAQVKEGIVINDGEETVLNFLMGESELDIAEVQVVAKANRESENFLMLEQKKASVIKESIGAARMSELGVSDAAAATEKISGVTKSEGSGDVYIRGLGDRYLMTTMNGLPVPSDDVEKKNIDLNLFSSDIIKNVGISKTYAVNTYGDQTSGAVDISSKTYSEKMKLDISGGINTNVLNDGVFDNFKTTQNMNDQSLGFYSSPYGTKDAITKQSWNTETKGLPIDYSASFLGGTKTKLFGNDLSIFGTVSQSGSSDYRTGVFKSYRSNVLDNSFNDVEQYITEFNTTGLLNLGYDLNINHSINYNVMFIHKTKDELYEQGRNGEGYVFDQDPAEYGAFVRDQNLKETTLFINQLLGSHEFNKHTVKWAVAYNMVRADEPNRIRNEVNMIDDYVQFAHVGDYQQRKSRQEIADNEITAYLRDDIKLGDEEKNNKIGFGADFRMKKRDFESQFIGVRAKGETFSSIDNMDEALLDMDRYNTGRLRIREGLPDTYTGKLNVYAGWLDYGFDFNKFSGSIGVRYEIDNIDIDWDVANFFDLETGTVRIGSNSMTYNNVLPSLNLKYALNEKSNLRFSASKTVTLPEFKEVAPFEYVSPTGRVTVGNPDLEQSENYNFDLKWELFPNRGELISATGFYKVINDPINRTLTKGASGNFTYENTGDKANVYGLELESRFKLIKAETTEMPGLDIAFNATKMWFSQDLLDEFQYNHKTTSELEGASEFIFNGALIFSNNKPNKFTATVSGNYASDKIFSLGSQEDFENRNTEFNSEIVEKGFVTLDAVISKKLSDRVTLKFTAKNLLNPEIEQTQLIVPLTGDASYTDVVRSYKKGVDLKVGISINLN